MNTRQWICLSGQYYAYISHDEQNEWMTFIRGTPEVLEEVLTDKLIYRLEADWARLLGHGDDPRTLLEELLVRDQKASAALAAKARQWVEEELPKLRAEREEVDQEAKDRQETAKRGADDWNRDTALGTAVMYLGLGVKDAVLLWTRSEAYAERGRAFVFVRDQISALPLHEFVGHATNAEISDAGEEDAEHGVRGTEYEFKSAKELTETWNKDHPVGTDVEYINGPGSEPMITKTTGEAYDACGIPTIQLEGISVSVPLSKCSPS